MTVPLQHRGHDQWLRRATLKVTEKPAAGAPSTMGAPATGLDLSDLHFRFQVQGSYLATPNVCVVRIYNVSPETAKVLVDESDYLFLTAGYQPDKDSIIFAGQIRQYKRGREGTTDTFIEMIAATADINFNFGYVNVTVGSASGAKATYTDWYNAICDSMNLARDSVSQANIAQKTNRMFIPRGRVVNGLGRIQMQELAKSIGAQWSVQTINGVDTAILLNTAQPRPGEATVIGPTSGLIGVPEATVEGVVVRCLLNPTLQIGSLVQIDAALIATVDTPLDRLQATGVGPVTIESITAGLNASGFYCVLAVDHVGDTRGQDWYSELICLATNIDTQKGQ